ncbi:Stp1/IreP family PP2C-type Ser/Thr phosphatase [Peptoniphilus equinus]|uniref:Stp1/IreP family PP2C-type Ser/Thr phosphatase n=1 Tax=Peptoniphilus equinus TaxID=3016343 RepID=A0ABY7QR31_9FIRM|nr:Stp1/IreP family PP2C-type Ser/Thr phosphatase [Peptoniphilus equinus]WBW49251.1 Stp1/IreP family PP2C-type Ser/Thr phosphatase [Peptoniphilus equinus]
MKFVVKHHIGNVREINEDYYYATEHSPLYIVADGMGGHLAGEIASQTAVTVIEEALSSDFSQPVELSGDIQNAVEAANKKVYDLSVADLSKRGMGTTLSLVYVKDDVLYFTNVGDSRIYSKGAEFKQLTVDDSYVNYLVTIGEITKEEAQNHPKKNIITRALGTTASLNVAVQHLDWKEQSIDKLLLCSDGLSNMVGDEILSILLEKDSDSAANELLQLALDSGGLDNITFIIIDLK